MIPHEVREMLDKEYHLSECDPISQHLRVRGFVSKSKGKGQKRRYWKEVILIGDTYSGRWYSFNRFPFDTAVVEIWGRGVDQVDMRNELMNEVKRRAGSCR